MVVSCFGVLLSTLFTVSVLPLAVGICFAIAAKTVGFARTYILSGADGDDRLVARMAPLLDIVRWMLLTSAAWIGGDGPCIACFLVLRPCFGGLRRLLTG